MKKIILYLLLFLLIAGLATLAYGFWNAKNIRQWASAASQIKARHDSILADNNTEKRFAADRGKSMEELKSDLVVFSSDLGKISKETVAAREETKNLREPKVAAEIGRELDSYYQLGGEKIKGLSSIFNFMNQFIDTLDTFDKISTDTTLDDIRNLIGDAKAKSSLMDTNQLPIEVKTSGDALVVELDNFFTAAEGRIEGKSEAGGQASLLSSDSSQFAEKETNFMEDIKKYEDSFQNLDSLQKKITNDLAVLENVKFSLK